MRNRDVNLELRLFRLTAVIMFSCGLVLAQQAPAPAQQAALASAQSAPAPYTLHVPVPLVVEDVVVLDRSGQPVRGLKASDLTVTENGKPVTPRYFQEHSAATEQPAPEPRLPYLGPNVFTDMIATPATDSLNILLLDTLNTPTTDQEAVRTQMFKYLKTLRPGRTIAIFGLGSDLRLLQRFTADPKLLQAAIDKPNIVQPSRMLENRFSDDPLTKDKELSEGFIALGEERKKLEARVQATVTLNRGLLTQQALIQLGRYIAGLPGRKNLIWFSASFPLLALPDILVRNRVAVYPVDARGLCDVCGGGNSLPAEPVAMIKLAESTGGKAFYQTNAFEEAVEKAGGDGDNYYTFAFTPPNQKWDGSYRKVAITVDRPDLHLSYRTGYLANDPNVAVRTQDALPQSAMQTAMKPGAPAATQLVFDVQVIPDDTTGNKITKDAKPDPRLMKPPYRRYNLLYGMDIHDVAFSMTPDGVRHGTFDFAVLVYDAEGEVVNQASSQISADLTPKLYAQILARGLRAYQVVETPAKGDYFLRMGVRDVASDRIGVTEIPTSSLKSKQAMADETTKNPQSSTAK